MKYLLTNEEMRTADSLEMVRTPALELMERAGLALAEESVRLAPSDRILCVCGGGNNGGDGFVCARLLKGKGRAVDVVCYAEKFSPECAENRSRWQREGGAILREFPTDGYALVVDCLYGSGFHGALTGKDKRTVEEINERKSRGAKVLSADIPSGLNGENGLAHGLAVCADVTICLGEFKIAVYLNDGLDYAGKPVRADIGISLPKKEYAFLVDREYAKGRLPVRKRNSHKGSYGKAAIVGGSIEYTGAAYLSASACLRSGTGYTALFVPESLLSLYALKAPELLLRGTNEGGRYALNEEKMRALLDYDSVAYGMGMGVSEEVYKGARWLLSHYEGRLILDADGLNSLAAYAEDLPALFANKKCDVAWTPHYKELARLTGVDVRNVAEGGVAYAKSVAEKHRITLLLKNASSVITDGKRTAVNVTGNSGQAKGGSGDVLAGVLAGLCAQGLNPFDGATLASYLVGKAAELGGKKTGEYALTASDLVANLGKAFLSLSENADEYGGEE